MMSTTPSSKRGVGSSGSSVSAASPHRRSHTPTRYQQSSHASPYAYSTQPTTDRSINHRPRSSTPHRETPATCVSATPYAAAAAAGANHSALLRSPITNTPQFSYNARLPQPIAVATPDSTRSRGRPHQPVGTPSPSSYQYPQHSYSYHGRSLSPHPYANRPPSPHAYASSSGASFASPSMTAIQSLLSPKSLLPSSSLLPSATSISSTPHSNSSSNSNFTDSIKLLSAGEACTLYARQQSVLGQAIRRSQGHKLESNEAIDAAAVESDSILTLPVHVFLHTPTLLMSRDSIAASVTDRSLSSETSVIAGLTSPHRHIVQPVGSPHSPYYSHSISKSSPASRSGSPARFAAINAASSASPATDASSSQVAVTVYTHSDLILQQSRFIVMPAALYSDRARNLKGSNRLDKIDRERKWIDRFIEEYPAMQLPLTQMNDLFLGKSHFQQFLVRNKGALAADISSGVQSDACYTLVSRENNNEDGPSIPASQFCLESFSSSQRQSFTAALIDLMQFFTHQDVIRHKREEEARSRRQSAINMLKQMQQDDRALSNKSISDSPSQVSSHNSGVGHHDASSSPEDRYSFASASLTRSSLDPNYSQVVPNSFLTSILSPSNAPSDRLVMDLTPFLAHSCMEPPANIVKQSLAILSKGNSFVWHRVRKQHATTIATANGNSPNKLLSPTSGIVHSSAVYVFLYCPLLHSDPSTNSREYLSFSTDFERIIEKSSIVWMDINQYNEICISSSDEPSSDNHSNRAGSRRFIYQHPLSNKLHLSPVHPTTGRPSPHYSLPSDEELNQPSQVQIEAEHALLTSFLHLHPSNQILLSDLSDLYLGKSGPSLAKNEAGASSCIFSLSRESPSIELQHSIRAQLKYVKRDTCFTLVSSQPSTNPSTSSSDSCLSLQSSSLLLRSQFTDSLLEVMKFLTQLEIRRRLQPKITQSLQPTQHTLQQTQSIIQPQSTELPPPAADEAIHADEIITNGSIEKAEVPTPSFDPLPPVVPLVISSAAIIPLSDNTSNSDTRSRLDRLLAEQEAERAEAQAKVIREEEEEEAAALAAELAATEDSKIAEVEVAAAAAAAAAASDSTADPIHVESIPVDESDSTVAQLPPKRESVIFVTPPNMSVRPSISLTRAQQIELPAENDDEKEEEKAWLSEISSGSEVEDDSDMSGASESHTPRAKLNGDDEDQLFLAAKAAAALESSVHEYQSPQLPPSFGKDSQDSKEPESEPALPQPVFRSPLIKRKDSVSAAPITPQSDSKDSDLKNKGRRLSMLLASNRAEQTTQPETPNSQDEQTATAELNRKQAEEEQEARMKAEVDAAAQRQRELDAEQRKLEEQVEQERKAEALADEQRSTEEANAAKEEAAAAAAAAATDLAEKRAAADVVARRRMSILQSAMQAASQAQVSLPDEVEEESEDEESKLDSDDELSDSSSSEVAPPSFHDEQILPHEDVYQAQQRVLREAVDPIAKAAREKTALELEDERKERTRRASRSEGEWIAYLDPTTNNYYWFNPATQISSWTDPRESTRLKLEADKKAKARRASRSDGEWDAYLDDQTGKIYWNNKRTGVTQWDDPRAEAIAARIERDRLKTEAARREQQRLEQEARDQALEKERYELMLREKAAEEVRAKEESDRLAAIEANKLAIRQEEERREAERKAVAEEEERRQAEAEERRKAAFQAAKERAAAEATAAAAEAAAIEVAKADRAARQAAVEEEKRQAAERKKREEAPAGASMDDGFDQDEANAPPIDMSEWASYTDAKGREYWHCARTGVTIWNHPERQRQKDREKRRAAAAKVKQEEEEAKNVAFELERQRQQEEEARAKIASEEEGKQKRKESLSRFQAAQAALNAQFGGSDPSAAVEAAASAVSVPAPAAEVSSLANVNIDEVIDMTEWQSFEDAKSRTYWYNMRTGETIWMHPQKRLERARKKVEMETALAEAKKLAQVEAEQAAAKKKIAAENEAKRQERERIEKEEFDRDQEAKKAQREKEAAETVPAASAPESSATSSSLVDADALQSKPKSTRFLAAQQALSAQFGASVVAGAPASRFSQPPLDQRNEHKRRESKSTEAWTAYTDPVTGQVYWHNAATNESSWTNPNTIAPADTSEWTAHQSDDGKTYWFNATTNETTWLSPYLVGEERAKEEARLLAEAKEEERLEREELEKAAQAEANAKLAEERAKQALEEAAERAAAEAAEAEEARALEEAQRQEEEVRDKARKEEEEKKEASRRLSQSGEGWAAYTDSQGRTYWYNHLLKESSWTDPRPSTIAAATAAAAEKEKLEKAAAEKAAADKAAVEAAEPQSPKSPMSPGGASFTEEEIEAAWKSYIDKSGKQYWYNSLTKVSCWNDPRKDRTKLSPGNIHVSRRVSYWAQKQKQNLHAVLESEEEHEASKQSEEEIDEAEREARDKAARRKLNLSAISDNVIEEEDDEDEEEVSSARKKKSRKSVTSDSESGSSSEEDEGEEMYQARAAMVPEESFKINDVSAAVSYSEAGGNFIRYLPANSPENPSDECKEQAVQMWVEYPSAGIKPVSEKLAAARVFWTVVSGARVASPAILKDKSADKTESCLLGDLTEVNTGLPDEVNVVESNSLTPLPMTTQQCLTLRSKDRSLFLRSYRLTRDRRQTAKDEATYGYDKRTLDEAEQQRENWMLALRQLMAPAPSSNAAATASSSVDAISPSAPSTQSNPLKTPFVQKPLENLGLFDVAMRLMRRGALFTRFLPDRSHQSIYMWLHVPGVPELLSGAAAKQAPATPASVLHFDDLHLATLQWVNASDSVDKQVDPARSLPLTLIQDVFAGKNMTISPVSKSIWSNSNFAGVDDASVLSYLSPAAGEGGSIPNILALQASSSKVRDAWLNAWGAYWAQEQAHREQTLSSGSSVRNRANAVCLSWSETPYGAGKPEPDFAKKQPVAESGGSSLVSANSDAPTSGEAEPVEQWIEYTDLVKNRKYYYNVQTKKTVWKDPRKLKRNSIVLSPVTKKPVPDLPPKANSDDDAKSPVSGTASPTNPDTSSSSATSPPSTLTRSPSGRNLAPPVPAKKKQSDGSSPKSISAAALAMSNQRMNRRASAAFVGTNVPIASKKSFLEESLDLMRSGAFFTRYQLNQGVDRSFGSEITETRIFMWLDAITRGKDAAFPDVSNGTPSGAVLCWNQVLPGSMQSPDSLKVVDVNTSRLRIEHLSELLLGKRSRLFVHPSLGHVNPKQCFSWLSALDVTAAKAASAAGSGASSSSSSLGEHPLDLHVSASTEQTRDGWFGGICEVLSEYVGWLPLVQKDTDASSSIEAVADLIPNVTPLASVSADSKYTALPLHETLSLMEYGCVFRSYQFEESGSNVPVAQTSSSKPVIVNDIFLFGDFPLEDDSSTSFDANMSRSRAASDTGFAIPLSAEASARLSKEAAIYFCDAGEREKDSSRRFLLSEITDLYIGKKTPELKSLAAAGISEKFCWTLHSKKLGLALHLQTDSEYTRDAWLKGLISVLQNYSKRKMIAKRASVSVAPLQTSSSSSMPTPAGSLQALQARFKLPPAVNGLNGSSDQRHRSHTSI